MFAQKKFAKSKYIFLYKAKHAKSQRLKQLLDFVGIKPMTFADESGIRRSIVSDMLNDQRDVSKNSIELIAKWKQDVNVEWIMTGHGQMLKSDSNEKKSNESESLEAVVIEQFSSNLRCLLQAKEMGPANLSSLIGTSSETITQYLDQQRGPSLATLIRLRNLWGISIDALLFADLSQPGSMESNLNDQKAQEEIQRALEAILKKITELEERDNKREKEMEEMRKEIKAKQ